jgi:hypothetical protein
VEVVVLMVEGFIARLKAAGNTVLGQTPPTPVGGASDTTMGETKVGFVLLS